MHENIELPKLFLLKLLVHTSIHFQAKTLNLTLAKISNVLSFTGTKQYKKMLKKK